MDNCIHASLSSIIQHIFMKIIFPNFKTMLPIHSVFLPLLDLRSLSLSSGTRAAQFINTDSRILKSGQIRDDPFLCAGRKKTRNEKKEATRLIEIDPPSSWHVFFSAALCFVLCCLCHSCHAITLVLCVPSGVPAHS